MTGRTAQLDSLRDELRSRFAELGRRHGLEIRGARSDRDGDYPKPVWEALCRGNVIGAAIPAEYEGLGLGLAGIAVVLEELAAADIGDMVPILSTMAAEPVIQFGSEALKRELLPQVARGERRLAFAVTERESRSDVLAAELRAERDGEDFVLTGEKQWISAVDLADALLVLARTTPKAVCRQKGLDESAGLSMFVVDRSAAGIDWERMSLPRLRSVSQYVLRFDRVRVPAQRLVGAPGMGAVPSLTGINVERILIPALIVGATRWLLDVAVQHAKDHQAFGERSLGRFQAVQHPLAATLLRLQGLRLLLDHATEVYDSGANPFEVSLPTAAARFSALEVARHALDAAGTTLGARGFEPDIGLLGFAQMLQLLKAAPVSDPVLLNFVAEHHLGLPRSG